MRGSRRPRSERTGSPKTRSVPPRVARSPRQSFSSVVFPLPLVPRTARTSPPCASSETSRRTGCPRRYAYESRSAASAGALIGSAQAFDERELGQLQVLVERAEVLLRRRLLEADEDPGDELPHKGPPLRRVQREERVLQLRAVRRAEVLREEHAVRGHGSLLLDDLRVVEDLAVQLLGDVARDDAHVDLTGLERFPGLLVAAGQRDLAEERLRIRLLAGRGGDEPELHHARDRRDVARRRERARERGLLAAKVGELRHGAVLTDDPVREVERLLDLVLADDHLADFREREVGSRVLHRERGGPGAHERRVRVAKAERLDDARVGRREDDLDVAAKLLREVLAELFRVRGEGFRGRGRLDRDDELRRSRRRAWAGRARGEQEREDDEQGDAAGARHALLLSFGVGPEGRRSRLR